VSGPLDGITVLDLSKVLAGPYCTMILGDLGADVIKVEHPAGDETRRWGPPFVEGESTYYLAVNRNKRSIVADLANDDDRALIRRIALKADVLAENFLPGSLERLGISLDALRRENPRLITLTVSGMGASGPDAAVPGYDFIVQAASGLMSITGPEAGPPSKLGVAVVDLTTGMMAANAVLAALYSRERTGHGQHIDISLLETAVSWLANVGTAYLMTGREPHRHGNAHPTIVPYQTFRVADGDVAIGVGTDPQFQRLCNALELTEIGKDARYATNAGRVTHRAELVNAIAVAIAGRSIDDVVRRLRAHSVPAGVVRTIPEVMNDPQIAAREMIQTTTHPTIGEVRLLGVPYKFSETPASLRRHPPLLGEHSAEVRAQFRQGT
jgi:crotonobetainyl-CoA:carnitine CoA-transferase CaiB-like acyl-CoA transferase